MEGKEGGVGVSCDEDTPLGGRAGLKTATRGTPNTRRPQGSELVSRPEGHPSKWPPRGSVGGEISGVTSPTHTHTDRQGRAREKVAPHS